MEQSRRIMPTSEQYVVHWQSAVYKEVNNNQTIQIQWQLDLET